MTTLVCTWVAMILADLLLPSWVLGMTVHESCLRAKLVSMRLLYAVGLRRSTRAAWAIHALRKRLRFTSI